MIYDTIEKVVFSYIIRDHHLAKRRHPSISSFSSPTKQKSNVKIAREDWHHSIIHALTSDAPSNISSTLLI
jgi:hypothetical protein